MTLRLSKLQEQALQLSREDREQLVTSLLRSLRHEMPSEIDPAWLVEAEKRYREYKEGRVEGIPADQVFEDIPRELGWSA